MAAATEPVWTRAEQVSITMTGTVYVREFKIKESGEKIDMSHLAGHRTANGRLREQFDVGIVETAVSMKLGVPATSGLKVEIGQLVTGIIALMPDGRYLEGAVRIVSQSYGGATKGAFEYDIEGGFSGDITTTAPAP